MNSHWRLDTDRYDDNQFYSDSELLKNFHTLSGTQLEVNLVRLKLNE